MKTHSTHLGVLSNGLERHIFRCLLRSGLDQELILLLGEQLLDAALDIPLGVLKELGHVR